MGLCWQIYGTCSICLLSLCMGLMYAWPSSTIKLFETNSGNILTRAMTPTEIALFSSLSSVGALIGTPLFGYALDKIGRKYTAILAGLSYVIAWTTIAACKQVELILSAVFISGLGGCCVLISPLYVGEISHVSIRGALTSGSAIFYGIGVLLSYILGGYMTYYGNIYTQLTLSVLYIVLVGTLKESPMFLMKKGLEQDAAKSIAFYRGQSAASKEVLEELNTLRRVLHPNQEQEELEEQLKLNSNETRQQPNIKLSQWRFILSSESTKRALLVALVLITGSIFMGFVAVQVFAEPLFYILAPTLDANLCSILLAVVSIIFNLIAAYCTDKAGRKALMIYSSMASGIFTILIGIQMQLSWAPPVVAASLLYLFCAAFSMGAAIVPYVLVAEVFLPEIKSFCAILVIEWGWLTNFLILFLFNPLKEIIGIGGVFYIFGAISFATMIFVMFYQPETKGLTVDVIQNLFIKRPKVQRNVTTL